MGPVNPPGTDEAEQRCEFCLIGLGGRNRNLRSRISRDPDYIAANLCIYCDKCRKSKLGRISDGDYLDPRKKWRRIVYTMFHRAENVDGFWRYNEELQPFE